MSGLKLVAGPEREAQLTPDLANGRVFFNRTMVVDRKGRDQPPEPIMDAITTLFPGTTEATIKAKVAEAAARELDQGK